MDWRVYNITRRAVGVGMLCVGAVLATYTVRLLVDPGAVLLVNGIPTPDVAPRLVALVASLAAMGVGIVLLRLRPYRPDLGDISWLSAPFEARERARTESPDEKRRDWLTGDPLPTRRPRQVSTQPGVRRGS